MTIAEDSHLGTPKTVDTLEGDPFQSVYSFRGAEVAVFRDRHAAVSRATGEEACSASLTTNFRSHPEILKVINHIFGHQLWFGPDFPALAAPDGSAQVDDLPEGTCLLYTSPSPRDRTR